MTDVARIKEALAKIREGVDLLSKGPIDYYVSELVAAHDFMMGRFCPFKIGDRVRLSSTPKIDELTASGWMSAKHFLIEGAEGVVREATCGSRGFRFDIEFDGESWVDRDHVVHPRTHKHTFGFGESALASIDRSDLS